MEVAYHEHGLLEKFFHMVTRTEVRCKIGTCSNYGGEYISPPIRRAGNC